MIIYSFVLGVITRGKEEGIYAPDFVQNAKALIGTDQEKEFPKNLC